MNLIQTLKTMGREADEHIPNLNFGGCCVYAAAVTRRLNALGVPAWGRSADQFVPPRLTAHTLLVARLRNEMRYKREANLTGIDFGHVLVQFMFDGQVWTHDSRYTEAFIEGREGNYGYSLYPGTLTPRELTRFANEDSWNKMFDRSTSIPLVRQIVHKYLAPSNLGGL